MSQTINEAITELHTSLLEYIEATYHIGHPALIEQRHAILLEQGVIHQEPFIESTPRYKTGGHFRQIPNVHPAALSLFELLSQPLKGKQLVYNPPYEHQADSIEAVLGPQKKGAIIMTGTGSGKTESFLLPILGKLAIEAASNPEVFRRHDGMRALILYPMNALVNDQLGRLRAFFGDPRLVELFQGWAQRLPRFARYTSRTPYAGMRSPEKDGEKLKPFRNFYVRQLQLARSDQTPEGPFAQRLIDQLREKGKWPAKPDIESWFGQGDWKKRGTDTYQRAVTLPLDSELLTRHEIQAWVPDLLVTNYSMLEYMMMRPIERPIFDHTREWLAQSPNENFLVVMDEAHLYRGAAGAEVGHLLRRLRDRLGIPQERFQVICATASFSNAKNAESFASQLSGVAESSFIAIEGSKQYRTNSCAGTERDAAVLAAIDLEGFYKDDVETRRRAIQELLEYRQVTPTAVIEQDLFHALEHFGPLVQLVNVTMGNATPIAEIGAAIFPGIQSQLATLATSNLASLASAARLAPTEPSLLPCRVHSFYRGLHGLWICMDPHCGGVEASTSHVAGKMYSQPRETCNCCGARVLELYTCRYCGTAYARGYVSDIPEPTLIWPASGAMLSTEGGHHLPLHAIDLLLETPSDSADAEKMSYDLETGQLNAAVLGPRMRDVYVKASRTGPPRPAAADHDDEHDEFVTYEGGGIFQPCAVCNEHGHRGRAPVQDHETKGDQPFQVLLTKQLSIQPPSPKAATSFAPLRGRKVLAFSDSRQVAARLAPNLQMFAARDGLRSLIVRGFEHIQRIPNFTTRLDDLYAAILIAAAELKVRLRPERRAGESFHFERVRQEVFAGVLNSPEELRTLCVELRSERPPESLFGDIYESLRDRSRGLEALALGSVVERADKRPGICALRDIPGVATTSEEKLALVRAWIRCWHFCGVFLNAAPGAWYDGSSGKRRIKSAKGEFSKRMGRLIPTPDARKIFKSHWLPYLRDHLTEDMGGKQYRLLGRELTLELGGEWVRCQKCKSVHRPLATTDVCQECGNRALMPLQPETDNVFIARKGFYRNAILRALGERPEPPLALIAAEHTAQLNSPQVEDVFSKAEQNELLFQDVELPAETSSMPFSAIDVLSSTTTMEVGIDIGQLSGVALRNMPPARANYQQRAGRAGRRGSAIATVVAYGGSDTHDEHYFSNPHEMISGEVIDPKLSLDKMEIARRHIRAFLLQNYHMARLPEIGTPLSGDLFSVLGTVADFKGNGTLNIKDFQRWLNENAGDLGVRLDDWLPRELKSDRVDLISNMVDDAVTAIGRAINEYEPIHSHSTAQSASAGSAEVAPEVGEERPAETADKSKLLDWLLYKAVLPRYAFPTDVATFYVFDYERSSSFRSVPRFAPSQGLPVALSQYAPGKQIWISGKCYTSGALYSPTHQDLSKAWQDRKLFLECTVCGYSSIQSPAEGIQIGGKLNCDACGSHNSVGPIRNWLRPPGFAHPITEQEVTSPDDMPDTSYATRAQLTMVTPPGNVWTDVGSRIRVISLQEKLLVSNSGPEREGYIYCVACGRIEAETAHDKKLGKRHDKPYIADEQHCDFRATRHLVLGSDFITDVALFSLRLTYPFSLSPTNSVTRIVLRTLSEALARAATNLLQIEPGEIMAEFRPALTDAGIRGLEAEIFLYDTLPGGAGFSQNAAALGEELFYEALKITMSCKGDCDASCYRCLRTFRNRTEHSLLDRHVGASLLKYLLAEDRDGYAESRIRSSEHLLHAALSRVSLPGVTMTHNFIEQDGAGRKVRIPIVLTDRNGLRLFVALSNPLSEGVPADTDLTEFHLKNKKSMTVVNELIIRKNTPAAMEQIIRALEALSP